MFQDEIAVSAGGIPATSPGSDGPQGSSFKPLGSSPPFDRRLELLTAAEDPLNRLTTDFDRQDHVTAADPSVLPAAQETERAGIRFSQV
jgi:hypothetical protein